MVTTQRIAARAPRIGLPRATARTAEDRAVLDGVGSVSVEREARPLWAGIANRFADLLLVLLLPYALGAAMLVGGLAIVLPIKLVVSLVL